MLVFLNIIVKPNMIPDLTVDMILMIITKAFSSVYSHQTKSLQA